MGRREKKEYVKNRLSGETKGKLGSGKVTGLKMEKPREGRRNDLEKVL
jgi:hypothetical protein